MSNDSIISISSNFSTGIPKLCLTSKPPNTNGSPEIALIYVFLFIFSFVGNFTMFLILCRNQMVKVRRVHSLLLHMNIAHLIVTIVVIPKEAVIHYWIGWFAGNVMCKMFKFFDAFSVILSMNVLICITLDRFYSIFFPLYAMRARKSVQKWVMCAWFVSFLAALPQVFLFRLAIHPCYPWFMQCVSRNLVFEVPQAVVFIFSILNLAEVYFIPLIITVVCYSLILWKISKKSKNEKGSEKSSESLLRRNGQNNLERAKSRTLKMTFVIVLAFIFCWTPYSICTFLHFLGMGNIIPGNYRKVIYAFAFFNSAISPYLYGYFSFDIRKELQLLVACSKSTASDRHLSCSANVQRTQASERMRKRSASACNFEDKTCLTLKPPRGQSLRHKNLHSTLANNNNNALNQYMSLDV